MSNNKPQEALKLGLNVLIDQGCGGYNCNWHEFPYEINSIISGDRRKKIRFNNGNDVWKYVDLLRSESEEHRKEGSSFTVLTDIFEQLPFFSCVNKIINEKAQKDISRYIFTNEANVPAYSGSYGDTPHIWVQKYYIIKQAMIYRENKLREKAKDGNK